MQRQVQPNNQGSGGPQLGTLTIQVSLLPSSPATFGNPSQPPFLATYPCSNYTHPQLPVQVSTRFYAFEQPNGLSPAAPQNLFKNPQIQNYVNVPQTGFLYHQGVFQQCPPGFILKRSIGTSPVIELTEPAFRLGLSDADLNQKQVVHSETGAQTDKLEGHRLSLSSVVEPWKTSRLSGESPDHLSEVANNLSSSPMNFSGNLQIEEIRPLQVDNPDGDLPEESMSPNQESASMIDDGDSDLQDDELKDGVDRVSAIKLSHFENLNKLLIMIFSGKEISEADWCLSSIEAKILNSILQRKFFSKAHSEGIRLNDSDRFAFINNIAKINTLKRPKDCYKMLLGRLFRILKRNFFEKNATSNQNVYLFYQYYFSDLAKAEHQQIQAYFYPFERNNKFTSLFPRITHHLNFRYYERIFRSERFASDIKALLKRVYSDHFAELKFKFTTLLKKWERLFFNFDGDQSIVEKSILKYLQFNNRCKIPFTAIEIQNSIQLFERMISKFAKNRDDQRKLVKLTPVQNNH